jgi:type I restriction enzyme S subunit
MSREWIPRLPKDWQHTQIRHLARVFAGGTPDRKKPDFWLNGSIPWLNSGAVNQGKITEPSEYVTELAASTGATRWVRKASVVVALAGQGKTKGMAARTEIDTTLNQSLAAIEPGPRLNYRFLHYWLMANYQNLRGLAGGDLRDGLNLDHIGSVHVPLPPTVKQQEVADYLDRETAEIDAFISDQQAFRHLLIERWVSGLVNIVQPQLLEQDSLHSPKLRPSWTRTRLKSTVESDKNGSWGSDEGVDQVTRRCIRVADFDKHSGRIHSRSETNRSYPIDQASSLALKAGDLLIEKSGGGPTSPVGNVVLYTGPGGDLYSNFVARIRLQAGIDPRFALYLHRALYLSGVTNRSIKQTTGIQNLDSSSYFNETVWLPSPEEQKVLGQRVEAQRDFIDETLKDVDLSIRLAEERRAALISAAVTGQIDVVSHGVSAAERLQDELEVHV